MGISRSSKRPQGKSALNPQQQRAFTHTKKSATTPGTTGVGTSAPAVGVRTNWGEVEAKFQQGARRSKAKRDTVSDKQVNEQMRKTNRSRVTTGRTMARPALKTRQSAHAGVAKRHQVGTTWLKNSWLCAPKHFLQSASNSPLARAENVR